MSKADRRRFLRAALGGTVLLPAALRAQVLDPNDSTFVDPPPPPDTPRVDPSRSPPSEPRTPRRRKRKDEPEELPLLYPYVLPRGGTIAVCAPAGGVTRGDANDAEAALRGLGFRVKMGEHLLKGYGYLAGRDEERAGELMRFVNDSEVDAIMAVRGGYGVMRILPMLDFAAIRASRKIIVGYSDITALVNAIYRLSRMVAFHGPVATSAFERYSLDSFRRVVMSASPAGTFGDSDEFNGSRFTERRASTIVSGRKQGRIVGGNLTLVTGLMGTPYEIDTRGAILFIEEVEEEPYKIDRMLTQLAISGKLAACNGVAIGRFSKCEAGGSTYRLIGSLEEIIRRTLEPLGVPAVYGLPIGHIRSKITVPVGVLATLDADARTLTFDEAAVVERETRSE